MVRHLASGLLLLPALTGITGCSTPAESLSISVTVQPMEELDQYLFDVMVERGGQPLAAPRLLVPAGETGSLTVGLGEGGTLSLDVTSIVNEKESKP